jgi:fluoroacetyl-CoA thioesterase
MPAIELGLKGEKEMVVKRQDLASVMGNIGAEVLSTHRVVLLMELAARKAVENRLPEGMMTVGTFVRIQHLAAAPLGSKVRAEAHLKRIEGRRLVFELEVFDETEKLAEGENEQLIVSVDQFLSRIKKKVRRQEKGLG